jgi:MoaA/NifB/PqqE/SkfB family radical SAM enzyme
MKNKNIYTTDDRVKHSSKFDVNEVLGDIIGQRFVDYRKKWDLANNYQLETDFPLFIQLDMDQVCNLKCPHCALNSVDNLSDFYSEKLTWNDYKNIIAEGEEHGCPSIAHTGFNEPLLDKNFERYIEYASLHNFIDIHFLTNATLLTEKRAQRLLDSGMTRIRFSIDAASSETFKIVRKGSYDKVIRNIDRFLELKEKGGYKLPVTGVNFCKINLNEHEVETFKNYWSDKVDMVSIQSFIPANSEQKNLQFYPSENFGQSHLIKDFQCPQPFQRVVLRNKYITPCCSLDEDLVLGTIGKDKIYDVWNSDRMKHLRQLHIDKQYEKNPACKVCAERIHGIAVSTN